MTMSMSDGDLHVNDKHPFPRRVPSGVDSVSDSILSPKGSPSGVDSVFNGDFLG